MKKVCIDPGHGGKDSGAAWGENYDYVEEDDINLIISFLLRYELLLTRKFDVELTREKDIGVSLIDRVQMANDFGAGIFLSVHVDAWHSKTAKGISTHVYPRCSQGALDLATKIQHELIDRFHKHLNRGIRRSDFYVLRKTRMPAVLVECEFISNLDMRRFLKEPENQIEIARTISRGIVNYFNVRRKL